MISGVLLALLATMAAKPDPAPQEPVCHAGTCVREAVNADGSRVRIRWSDTGEIDKDTIESATYRILHARRGSDHFVPALDSVNPPEGETIRMVLFTDIDGDGFQELHVVGVCGAGPNCSGDLYRLDPDTGRFHHLFSGGWADVTIFDGHIVTSGRSSCCAWEHQAWPLRPGQPLRVSGSMAFRIQVGALIRDDGAGCAFTRDTPGGTETIAPPNAGWLRFCEVYGEDYDLAPPKATRPADSPADED